MKKIAFIILWLLVFMFLLTKFGNLIKQSNNTNCCKTKIVKTTDTLSKWDIFYLALTHVESRNIISSINKKTGALGLIQSLPEGHAGYIDEANRILGYRKFTNHLLLSSPKANRECFEIVNKRHNPTKSIKRAIHLHNPKATKEYIDAIYKEMKKIELAANTSINQ